MPVDALGIVAPPVQRLGVRLATQHLSDILGSVERPT